MSDKFLRHYYKAIYGPLADKTIHNILKRELIEQFGFENMGLIADSLINRFFEITNQYAPLNKRLLPGQILWLAVAVDEKIGYGKTMVQSKLVPVILTLVTPNDLELMAENKASFKDLRPKTVARILKEAYTQGGVLSLTDVGVLLEISPQAISKAVSDYAKEYPNEVLPYRGTIHDMGPTLTHKRQAVELKLMGLLTTEIARQIHHDPSNVDVYQIDFERVYQLYKDGKNTNQISFLTKMSKHLVQEYIDLIEKYVSEGYNESNMSKVSKNMSKSISKNKN